MKIKKKIILPVLVSLLLLLICLCGFGYGENKSKTKVSPDTPILVGPPGSRFWTTYSNALELFGKPVVFCRTTHCDHQIGTAQDSYKNRYMSAEKPGDTVDLQLVAKADDRYETAGGMQTLFHKYPADGSPWIGKTHSGFYLKKDTGKIIQIAQVDSTYRDMGGRRGLMTRGMSNGELWTGDANGIVYRLNESKAIVKIGKYDRRWVTPVDRKKRLLLPLMMSKSTTEGSPWMAELGGIIYVETATQ